MPFAYNFWEQNLAHLLSCLATDLARIGCLFGVADDLLVLPLRLLAPLISLCCPSPPKPLNLAMWPWLATLAGWCGFFGGLVLCSWCSCGCSKLWCDGMDMVAEMKWKGCPLLLSLRMVKYLPPWAACLVTWDGLNNIFLWYGSAQSYLWYYLHLGISLYMEMIIPLRLFHFCQWCCTEAISTIRTDTTLAPIKLLNDEYEQCIPL